MAASSKKKDEFANIAFLKVTESAPNTLTFARLELMTALMTEKTALIIHRGEFILSQDSTRLSANGSSVTCALTLSDRVTPIWDLAQPEVLAYVERSRVDLNKGAGEAAKTDMHVQEANPIVRDFSSLPGGGLLVPADRLYIGVCGITAGAAIIASVRLYYTTMPLATDQYWELIEARRIMTT